MAGCRLTNRIAWFADGRCSLFVKIAGMKWKIPKKATTKIGMSQTK